MTQPAIYAGPRRDDWRTPDWLREKILAQYNPLIDLAACAESSLAPFHYSASNSFLSQERLAWEDVAWLNPPFSKAELFYRRVAHEMKKAPRKLVSIYKANLETAVWQDAILPSCSWVFAPRGRVAYEHPDGLAGDKPQFGSLLIGWNVPLIRDVSGVALIVKDPHAPVRA